MPTETQDQKPAASTFDGTKIPVMIMSCPNSITANNMTVMPVPLRRTLGRRHCAKALKPICTKESKRKI